MKIVIKIYFKILVISNAIKFVGLNMKSFIISEQSKQYVFLHSQTMSRMCNSKAKALDW